MSRNPTPMLPRQALSMIGAQLRAYFPPPVERNARLDMMALIVDAQRRNDPYLKGTAYGTQQA